LLTLAACGGGQPATLADIPVYPNAQQLEPGKNPMADTLAKNVQQAAALGGKIDQRMYTLPKDANWQQIKGFYSDKLGASGWSNVNLPIPDNEVMKLAIWKKGGQSLTVGDLTEPTSGDSFLLFSLASQ
jgi:hypothetical protein